MGTVIAGLWKVNQQAKSSSYQARDLTTSQGIVKKKKTFWEVLGRVIFFDGPNF